MHRFLRKKWLLAVLFSLFVLQSTAFLCASEKHSRTKIYDNTSYAFSAFYQLYTDSTPSNLLVELVTEYHRCFRFSNSQGPQAWIPGLRRLELRFDIGSSKKVVRILKKESNAFEILGLNTIASSFWYPAIKRLAKDIGMQFYGIPKKKKKFVKEKKLQKRTAFIYIKPLKKYKLHTIDVVGGRPAHSRENTFTVDVDVLSEKLKDHKILTAQAFFYLDKLPVTKNKCSTIKFAFIKGRCKVISIEQFQNSSAWYQSIKKVAHNAVLRYLQFARYHIHVLKKIPLEKPPLKENAT